MRTHSLACPATQLATPRGILDEVAENVGVPSNFTLLVCRHQQHPAVGSDELAQLRELGYLVAGDERRVPSLSEEDALTDPKTQLPVWREVQGILHDRELFDRLPTWVRLLLRLKGRTFPSSTAETIVALEAVLEEHPDFVPIHRYLASFYREENRREDAKRVDARLEQLLGPPAAESHP